MNRFHLVLILLLLFTGLARADFASEVIDLVNAERAAQGVKPLSYDPDLAAAAQLHSHDMGSQDYFDHDSQDGTKFYDRIIAQGYDYNICGENIAAGSSTPEAVVDVWMNSDGHRANILNPDFCDIGVGHAAVFGSTYTHYWTQDFGRKSGVTQCPDSVVPPASSPGADDAGGGCFIDSIDAGTGAPVQVLFVLFFVILTFKTVKANRETNDKVKSTQ